MPTITVWPDATPTGRWQISPWTVNGAATAHEATDDTSESDYVDASAVLGNLREVLEFDLSGLPGGAIVTSVRLVWRYERDGQAGYRVLVCAIDDDGNLVEGPDELPQFGAYDTKTTVTGLTRFELADGSDWSEYSRIGALVKTSGLGAEMTFLNLYWVKAEVTYETSGPSATVTAPTGTVAAVPQVTWTYSQPSGRPQTHYRSMIVDETTASAGGFDPETTTAATYDSGKVASSQLRAELVSPIPAGNWRAYVKAWSTLPNGQVVASAWDYETFTLSELAEPLAAPSSVGATYNPDRAVVNVTVPPTGLLSGLGAGDLLLRQADVWRADNASGGTTIPYAGPRGLGVADIAGGAPLLEHDSTQHWLWFPNVEPQYNQVYCDDSIDLSAADVFGARIHHQLTDSGSFEAVLFHGDSTAPEDDRLLVYGWPTGIYVFIGGDQFALFSAAGSPYAYRWWEVMVTADNGDGASSITVRMSNDTTTDHSAVVWATTETKTLNPVGGPLAQRPRVGAAPAVYPCSGRIDSVTVLADAAVAYQVNPAADVDVSSDPGTGQSSWDDSEGNTWSILRASDGYTVEMVTHSMVALDRRNDTVTPPAFTAAGTELLAAIVDDELVIDDPDNITDPHAWLVLAHWIRTLSGSEKTNATAALLSTAAVSVADQIILERSAGGSPWELLAVVPFVSDTTPVQYTDATVPLHSLAQYRAKASADDGSPPSAWTTSAVVDTFADRWWFIDETDPDLSVSLHVHTYGRVERRTSSVTRRAGLAAVAGSGSLGHDLDLEIWLFDEAERVALEALIGTGRPFRVVDILGVAGTFEVNGDVAKPMLRAAPAGDERTGLRDFHTFQLTLSEVS